MKRKFGVELEFPYDLYEDLESVVLKAAKITGHPAASSINRNPRTKGLHSSLSLSQKNCTRFWNLKPEHGNLVEITTPILDDPELIQKAFSAIMKGAREDADYEGWNVGLHVHIDVRDLLDRFSGEDGPEFSFKEEWIFKSVFHFWCLAEKFFFELQPSFREGSTYCKPTRKNHSFYNGSRVLNLPMGKVWSITFDSCECYGSIEIRLGASTRNAEDIANWTALCRDFIDSAILEAKSKTEPYQMDFEGFTEFCQTTTKVMNWARRKRRIT